MSGILRQWSLILHRKTANLLNMALILPILKILQKQIYIFYQNSIGGHFLFLTLVLKWKL